MEIARKVPSPAETPLDDAAPVLESLADAVIVAGRDGRIRYANPAVYALLGFSSADELVDSTLSQIIPERLLGAHMTAFARWARTGQGPLFGTPMRVAAMGADGAELPIELVLNAVEIAGERCVAASLRDVSSRVELEQRSSVFQGLVAALAEVRTVADAAPRVLAALGEGLGWDVACMWTVAPDEEALRCAGVWHATDVAPSEFIALTWRMPLDVGVGLPGRVWKTGEPAWIHEVDGEGNFPRRSASLADGLHGAFAFPITDRGEFLGVIELLHREPRPRDRALLATMQSVGEELGEFLARRRDDDERNALLAAEHAARLEAEAARAELAVLARTLQESLLPSMLPEIQGVELAAWYQPFAGGNDVGGDFYDVFRTSRQRWGLVLGDVCGKGAAAARLTALARYTIRAAAMQTRRPSAVLRLLHETLLRDAESRPDADRFVTAVYATLQRREDKVVLTVSVGGHPPPIVRRASGTLEIIECPGTILGIVPDVSLHEVEITLGAGDTVVLYTDGLTDIQGTSSTFGDDGLHSVLRRSQATDTSTLVRDIQRAALGAADANRRDDIAVLALRATR